MGLLSCRDHDSRPKHAALAFTLPSVRDSKSGMPSSVLATEGEHPLLADSELLNEILDVMYIKIHKVLRWPYPGRRHGPGYIGGAGTSERILTGTGTSADDILAEAFWALVAYPPEKARSWKALAVRIAHNKAVQALRTAGKGLRATDDRPELYLVSGDHRPTNAEGEDRSSIFEVLPDEWQDLETEYFALADVKTVQDLAREVLDEREQRIFLDIHFAGYSRKEIGEQLGLTGARVGQIYRSAMRQIEEDARYPYL